MNDLILLERMAHFEFGTFGQLVFPEGQKFYTVEKPWEYNRPMVSCIPEGTYEMKMRLSGVVSRSTGGQFVKGWEVVDVPDRTFIMIHPGNWPRNFQGCIGVGTDMKPMQDPKGDSFMGVMNSRTAFSQLMGLLGEDSNRHWELEIRTRQSTL